MTDQPAGATLPLAEVLAAYQTLRDVSEAIAPSQLSVLLLLLLHTIDEHPRAPVSVSVQALRSTPSVVSNALNRLEQRGLARRITSTGDGGSADRRQVLVEVTARGRDLLDALATIAIER